MHYISLCVPHTLFLSSLLLPAFCYVFNILGWEEFQWMNIGDRYSFSLSLLFLSFEFCALCSRTKFPSVGPAVALAASNFPWGWRPVWFVVEKVPKVLPPCAFSFNSQVGQFFMGSAKGSNLELPLPSPVKIFACITVPTVALRWCWENVNWCNICITFVNQSVYIISDWLNRWYVLSSFVIVFSQIYKKKSSVTELLTARLLMTFFETTNLHCSERYHSCYCIRFVCICMHQNTNG